MTKRDLTVKRPRGRPSVWAQEIADTICMRMESGETLQEICNTVGMPAVRTVNEWTERMPEFSAAFARARARGFDAIAAHALVIADTPFEGVEYITKGDGSTEEKRGDMLGHRKLQVETRLKLLAKWDPKRYGERTTVAGDPEAPLSLVGVSMTPDEFRLMALEIASKV